MAHDIERIEFDGEFELIQRACGGLIFDYPVLCITEGRKVISLNKAARSLFPDNVTKMFMITFNDYIAILPDDYKTAGNNLFSYRAANGLVAYPAALRGKKIMPGYYKLYQYRNGIAFNRYERMDRNGEPIAA